MCALGYQPLQKNLLFLPSPRPLQSANCPSLHFLGNSPLIYSFFVNPPPPKIGLFSEPPQYYNFSSLNLPHYLNLTKFLAKISHFNFLVMTEKNNFVNKFFLSLNISAHYVSIGAFPDIITHKHLICYSVCQL